MRQEVKMAEIGLVPFARVALEITVSGRWYAYDLS